MVLYGGRRWKQHHIMGVPPDDDDDDDDVLLYRAGHLCTAGRAYLVWEAVGVVGVYVHCVTAAMRTTASHSCRSHCTDREAVACQIKQRDLLHARIGLQRMLAASMRETS